MKKTVSLFIALFLFIAVSQAQDINKLFNKYSDDENFEYVSLGSLLMKFTKAFVPKEYNHLLSRMKGLKVLSINQTKENLSLYTSFQKDVIKLTENKNFEPVVTSSSKNDQSTILRRITKNDNADVVIVTKNKSEIILVWLNGKATKAELDKFFEEEMELVNDTVE